MKIITFVTDVTEITGEIQYEERVYHWGAIHGEPPTEVRTPCQSFSYKIEGKRFVDGEFISNWVQYT